MLETKNPAISLQYISIVLPAIDDPLVPWRSFWWNPEVFCHPSTFVFVVPFGHLFTIRFHCRIHRFDSENQRHDSGYLTVRYGKWTMKIEVYLLKMVIFHGYVSHNQMVHDSLVLLVFDSNHSWFAENVPSPWAHGKRVRRSPTAILNYCRKPW